MNRLWPGSSVVLLTEKLVNPCEFPDRAVQRFIAENSGIYDGSGGVNLADMGGFKSNIGQPKAKWKRFPTPSQRRREHSVHRRPCVVPQGA